MKDVTIIIKTFERPKCLTRLLTSIEKAGFQGKVLVADDSKEPSRDATMARFPDLVTDYLVMPFDSGASAGRNLLLKNVTTPYFVLCDDDFVFDERARLDRFHEILSSSEVELVGGPYFDLEPFSAWDMVKKILTMKFYAVRMQVTRQGIKRNFFGNFIEAAGGDVKPEYIEYKPPYTPCDFVQNFFMAKTVSVREKVGGWNAAIKIGEHEEFFFQAAKGGLKVAHTERAGVLHIPDLPKIYAKFRNRAQIYHPARFKNWF